MIWITSDWHLSHNKILEYDKRPFDNIEQMNDTIIDNVNQVVGREDVLYYLGDFAFSLNGKIDPVIGFLNRINCNNIHYILGNHDKIIRKNKQLLIDQGYLLSVNTEYVIHSKPSIFLHHFPFVTWDHANHGRWHCHGHCHHNLKDDPNTLRVDVGINGWNYYPVSLDQLSEKMSRKTFVPLDHHR